MKVLGRLCGSSLGRKYLLAITGLGLGTFVVAHLLGSLQVFLGAEVLNRYAYLLHYRGELLWVARLGLLTLVGLHVGTAVTLTLANRAARPKRYEAGKSPGASPAARTMLWSGLLVALFVGYHVLHYAVKAPVGFTGEDFRAFRATLADGTVCPDVFRTVIVSFSHPLVASLYVGGVGLLCWHLSHGVQSALQSLGLRNEAWDAAVRKLALVVAWGLFVGYVSIPLAVLCGYGKGVWR